ncbi:hypothetical protein XU18_0466 [Perkinsela sp. CCAP 1560/4]|nr:hypothetical protein XU18_0466 [Perkinsela sp. CCAP 1560/4]|eukprot:KNH09781.1 hypothetical protein XU18_0466 [Perkinsela sp. CCAP 1560/4]
MKKTKPVLKTLREATAAENETKKKVVQQSISPLGELKTLTWPSALPNPGKFVDFGDTPLSSAVNNHVQLSEKQIAADWANSPIFSFIQPLKTTSNSVTTDTTQNTEGSSGTNTGIRYSQVENHEPAGSNELSDTPHRDSYIGSFPPPPPPPMYKMTANGEQICTQSELTKAWDRWYTVAEQWWIAFPNYPPPPRHPKEMQDKAYTLEQWYRRIDFWWSYMQAVYFSPGNVHNMPASQYVTYILDRACVGS